jgi:hypothetical protein
VGRGEIGPFGAGADRRTDAELLPQRAGGEHDAEFEHPLDLDLRDVPWAPASGSTSVVIENAIDALHQPFESGAIELIGAAKTDAQLPGRGEPALIDWLSVGF